MCGISGILQFNNKQIEGTKLINMSRAMLKRGPDDTGIYTSDYIGLAHQRLSIIDTSDAGHQPMKRGKYTIVFNGEIYNFQELKNKLKQKGYSFQSNSDTEVLLYLFAEYKENMLPMLNGMFAIAIWDNELKELFLCRDRMGVKPLYYHLTNEALLFASEPKSIFATGIKSEIDSEQIPEWLLQRFVSGENTLLKGIKKILPGHYVYAKLNGEFSLKRWYKLSERINNHHTINNPEEWFEETFHSAVKYRMVADVPVGVLLSGGLDSSSVTASLKHSGYNNIKTFNIGFRNYEHDESKIAKQFADNLNFPFHSIYLEGEDLEQALKTTTVAHDEPLVHFNDPQIYAISNYAQKHVKVLLSGEGSDELMGGYVRYKTFRYLKQKNILKLILKFVPESKKSARVKKLERYLKSSTNEMMLLTNSANYFEEDFKNLRINEKLPLSNYRYEVIKEAKKIYPNNPTRQLLYYDQHTYLQSLNDRNDRATMAASIECREPFQDYRLVEGLGTLPLKYLTSGKKGKAILVNTMKKYLPEYIVNYRKVGLSVPWLNMIMNSINLRDAWLTFPDRISNDHLLFKELNIKKLHTEHANGNRLYEQLLIQLFMYDRWKEWYLKQFN
jgi:asparagine synthase (glutamine-hydrolysing)